MKKIAETELDEIYKRIDYIITSELKEYSLLPSYIDILGRNKGVKGDQGLYGWTVVFGVTDSDNNCISDLPWNLLQTIEQRIVGEIQIVSRVLFEIPREKCDNLN